MRDRKTKICKRCGTAIYHNNTTGYCQKCYKATQDEKKITHWLETGDTGCSTKTTLRNCIRDFIYEYQENKCDICKIDRIWNNKELKFILDHIDGDCSNNWAENLRLICPNCDSQLDTFKSKNKQSARIHR